ncbi:hypothetical protein [Methylobacterium tarhaniae]|uniref:hypothetical protein n=1 Tax=Methylobacterium tarhaniae TaxID=1187852 RepID=UPI000B193AC4|nr:hypothetical protein [Methylobacterium tarhaniae]
MDSDYGVIGLCVIRKLSGKIDDGPVERVQGQPGLRGVIVNPIALRGLWSQARHSRCLSPLCRPVSTKIPCRITEPRD